MGQKINPHGLRVGVIKDWDSYWYHEKQQSKDQILQIGMIKDWNSQLTAKAKSNMYSSKYIKLRKFIRNCMYHHKTKPILHRKILLT